MMSLCHQVKMFLLSLLVSLRMKRKRKMRKRMISTTMMRKMTVMEMTIWETKKMTNSCLRIK